jgi:general secretion pathway protein K
VTAVAIFAYVALAVMSAGRGGMAVVASRIEQTRLAAAADGGLYIAIQGLAVGDPAARWVIDGRARTERFANATLTIVVEDERGKVPLNGLSDAQLRALFQGAGAAGSRIDDLVAEYRAWETNAPWPVGTFGDGVGDPGRRGPFATVGELSVLPDMTPDLFARIAPVVTLFFGDGAFDFGHARPLAAATMSAQTGGVSPPPPTPAEVPGEGFDTGRRDDRYYGRALTVRVTAIAADGARTHRTAIVELTGDRADPFWIRYVE